MHFADHLVALVICIVAPALAYSSRKASHEDIHFEPSEKIGLYHSNALLLIILALVLVTIWRLPGRTLETLGFSWPEWNSALTFLLLAVCLVYALDIFFQFGRQQWRDKTRAQGGSAMAFIPSDKREFRHFAFLALAAGTSEEIIFRGFLLHYLIFWTGNSPEGIWGTSLFASGLFAFLHGYQGLKSVLKIFLVSLLLTAIFILSHSLLPVMIMHTLIDLLSGWIGYYFVQPIQQENSSDQEQ